MKRLLTIVLLIPVLAIAQKQPKPNINKALNSWKAGKIQEAKEMIDLATTYEKTMNDAKTWYYRGLIYATIDTTSNAEHKALADDAFNTALESFAKADELNKSSKTELFVQDAMGIPIPKSQQIGNWANAYMNKGATDYQEDNLEGALTNFQKVQKIMPTDTISYFYAGFTANGLEKYDLAIENFRKYIDNGGKSADALLSMYQIYSGPKEDKEKALAIAQEGMKKHPENSNFAKAEIGLLIDLGKVDAAKKGLEEAIKKEPDNKILHFYLGYVNANLKDVAAAKKSYEEALRVDPQYFDAQLYLAKLMYQEAADIKKEMASLGISEADRKKKFALDKTLVEKLKMALPYWEKAEKLNPSDQEVIDRLYTIYSDLDDQAQMKRIEKRMKELGLDN